MIEVAARHRGTLLGELLKRLRTHGSRKSCACVREYLTNMVPGTKMELVYATAGVDAARRFEYWNDVVCRHCIPAASRMLTDSAFDGRLAVRSVGIVDISAMMAPLHQWSRDAHHLRVRDDDDLWLGYMHAGRAMVEQGGRQANLQDRDMTLYDAARPFSFTLETKRIFLVRFPRRSLLQRFPAAESMTARTLNEHKPAAAQLRAMIEQAADIDFDRLHPRAADQFGSTLLDLLGLTLEFQMDGRERPVERDLYTQITAYIKRNLLDPDLSLKTLADAHCVSTRTVTRAFARRSDSAMNMVWKLRLETSRQALLDGRARNVTEAAFDHGFSDLSHYSQAFRKAFGVAPSTLLSKR